MTNEITFKICLYDCVKTMLTFEQMLLNILPSHELWKKSRLALKCTACFETCNHSIANAICKVNESSNETKLPATSIDTERDWRGHYSFVCWWLGLGKVWGWLWERGATGWEGALQRVKQRHPGLTFASLTLGCQSSPILERSTALYAELPCRGSLTAHPRGSGWESLADTHSQTEKIINHLVSFN